MNCELAHESISCAVYGELTDEQLHRLNRHLAGCPACRLEMEQVQAMKLLADAYLVQEPEANLVARSRMHLEEALDALPSKRWFERLSQHLQNNFAGLQSAPVAAALMLLIGAGAGVVGGFYYANAHTANLAVRGRGNFAPASYNPTPDSVAASTVDLSMPANSEAEIADVSSIRRDPASNFVEVRFNQVVPREVTGSITDPSIQQLLVLASRNAESPGVRDNSISLLAAQCRSNSCAGILQTLMIALAGDQDAGVRYEALDGLQPYVTTDESVRNAVLQAVMADPEPRIRSHAIAILVPAGADTSVRQVLTTVANTDQNAHIRAASRNVLNEVPEIQ